MVVEEKRVDFHGNGGVWMRWWDLEAEEEEMRDAILMK